MATKAELRQGKDATGTTNLASDDSAKNLTPKQLRRLESMKASDRGTPPYFSPKYRRRHPDQFLPLNG